MSTKSCSQCNVEKDVSEFHKRSDRRSGLKSRCKHCMNSRDRAKYNLRKRCQAEPTINEKRCGMCNIVKSACVFRKSYGKANLLKAYCAECENAYNREYNKNKRVTDPSYKSHLDFRRLIRNFRCAAAADDDEIDSHRLVSRETYNSWLGYQTKVKNVVGPVDIDHTYPDSKFNLSNPFERLIGTNVVNLSPMNASENRSKGAKVMPELILNQITIANDFLLETDLSDDERLKFEFLIETYEVFASFKLANVLKELGILK